MNLYDTLWNMYVSHTAFKPTIYQREKIISLCELTAVCVTYSESYSWKILEYDGNIFKIFERVSLVVLLKLLVRKIKDLNSKNKYSFVFLYKIIYISFKNRSQNQNKI